MNKVKYILLGFFLCLCMGIGSKLAVAKITRFKQENKSKLTINERVTRLETKVDKLEKEK